MACDWIPSSSLRPTTTRVISSPCEPPLAKAKAIGRGQRNSGGLSRLGGVVCQPESPCSGPTDVKPEFRWSVTVDRERQLGLIAKAGFEPTRALPPQSDLLKGSPSPHWASRCLKILLRQTVAQEDHMQRGSLALVSRKEKGPMFGSFAGPRRICMELASNGKE
jgi:hypothetical protein